MNKSSAFVSGFLVSCLLLQAKKVMADTDLEEAIGLLKQMHADQCQLQQVRGQLMVAHQNHDESAVQTLVPQMDSITRRVKPSEDRLKALKASINQNLDDKNAFETALLESGNCE